MQHKVTMLELSELVLQCKITVGHTYIIIPQGKCCYRCREWKDRENDFYKDASTRDGYSNKCKPCSSNYSKEKYIQNLTYKPEKNYAQIAEDKKKASTKPSALELAKARIKK